MYPSLLYPILYLYFFGLLIGILELTSDNDS